MPKDIRKEITDKIIAKLEQGVTPWAKPWGTQHHAGPATRPLRHDMTPYKGINVLSLWLDAEGKEFTSPLWLTYNQAKKMDAQVRKGERGSTVVFYSPITKTDEEGEETTYNLLKGYAVFNAEQIDGLPEHYYPTAEHDPLPDMEELVAELGAAYLCADLSVNNEPREDHASYIASWLKILKNDKAAIFTAAAKAQQANDYLHQIAATHKAQQAA